MNLAIQEIQEGSKIRETSRKYGIPHSTIINKLKSRTPLVRKTGPPTILTIEEENILVRWIKAMAKKGFPINRINLAQTVHDIVSSDERPTPFKDNLPGRAWMEGSFKRHKDISQRNTESIDFARSRVTEKDIRNWHCGLHDYLEGENASDILEDPDRIVNCDEAGFQTNPSSGIILGPTGMKNLYGLSENSKENITVLGTFSASGRVLPLCIVYPYERIPRDIAANINKDWSIGKSKNGWMTCKVFHGYIANTLIPALRNDGTKFPVLLLVDGYRSHISGEVSKLCQENSIILYALYPNSTHILQPADVSVFRPLKNSWRSVAQQYKLKTGTRVLTRALFAPLLEIALKAATASTISIGFRKCGERPFTCPFPGCGRSFTTSNIRKVHVRTHTGVKPYVCPHEDCKRAFASATNYKNHLRIHSGEKPYVCSLEGCKKRFTDYSSLYKHHMVHSQEKPYPCSLCARYYRQPTLTMHKRAAHGIIETDDGTEIVLGETVFTLAKNSSVGRKLKALNANILGFKENKMLLALTSENAEELGAENQYIVMADASQLATLEQFGVSIADEEKPQHALEQDST